MKYQLRKLRRMIYVVSFNSEYMGAFFRLKIRFLGLTSTKGLVIGGIVLLVVAALIVVPTVIGVIFTRNPTGNKNVIVIFRLI